MKSDMRNMRTPRDKVCVCLTESISKQILRMRGKDEIFGLENHGDDKKPSLADYANVFMIRGVNRQWRSPITFSFSKDPIKAHKLKDMINKVIVECQRVGLEVIATVCDQGTNNQETEEHYLKAGTANRNFGLVINGQEIVHLDDGCRNNLLTKNLHFRLDGENKVAKWVHLQQFYELDASYPTLRMCSKLTDTHISPNKVNKMKVKICTQVFSHSVGSLIKRIAQWDIKNNNKLPSEAADIADLLLFTYKLSIR
nr:unnamed protein product [Callosobruchus analis]